MKNMKKIVVLLMCLALVLGLAGCGCGSEKTEDSKKKTENESGENGENNSGVESGAASENNPEADTEGSDSSSELSISGSVELESATVKVGEETTIYINASEDTPVAAFELNLRYDKDVIEIVEHGMTEEFKSAYSGMYVSNDVDGMVIFTGASTNAEEEFYTGPMCYVKIKSIGETSAKANLSLTAGTLSTFDGTDHSGAFEMEDGVITIN